MEHRIGCFRTLISIIKLAGHRFPGVITRSSSEGQANSLSAPVDLKILKIVSYITPGSFLKWFRVSIVNPTDKLSYVFLVELKVVFWIQEYMACSPNDKRDHNIVLW